MSAASALRSPASSISSYVNPLRKTALAALMSRMPPSSASSGFANSHFTFNGGIPLRITLPNRGSWTGAARTWFPLPGNTIGRAESSGNSKPPAETGASSPGAIRHFPSRPRRATAQVCWIQATAGYPTEHLGSKLTPTETMGAPLRATVPPAENGRPPQRRDRGSTDNETAREQCRPGIGGPDTGARLAREGSD